MLLPEKVKEAIAKTLQEEKMLRHRHNYYIYGFEDGLSKGVELALSTPPDGSLIDEIIDIIQQDDFAINRGNKIAAIALRHLLYLENENRELREALEAGKVDNERLLREKHNLHVSYKELKKSGASLYRFKQYVHKRLDDAGIEKEPNGEHSKSGCRIGDRLDIILKKRKTRKP